MYISILSAVLSFLKILQSGTKVVDTLAKTAHLSTNSFIYHSILFKRRNPPPPPPPRINVVCSKELRVQNTTLIFGEGVGKQRGRGKVCPLCKKGPFMEVSQHICPSLYFAKL